MRNCTERIAGEMHLAEISRDSWEQKRKARAMSITHTKGVTMVPSGQLCKNHWQPLMLKTSTASTTAADPQRGRQRCSPPRRSCCYTSPGSREGASTTTTHASNRRVSGASRGTTLQTRAPQPGHIYPHLGHQSHHRSVLAVPRTLEVQWFRKCMCCRSWHHGFFIRH